ncbi:hypothetical protein QYM36_015331 [Artemia franciscana]|uniref:Reverse transcriptase RNase H-like domain-containing protein n=1 Tax=Artemia franciscana TaxID=6661 RepID=A0AA88H8Y4_ARTSF|nr:hypothetical protein QYM36_015331 [Artemia franciscana]
MEEIFQGLKGLTILVDDLLIYGAPQEEHNRRLADVLKRARQKGVKFNRSNSSPTLELEVDASKHGLGAQISANGKIFAYASRLLSKSKQNYSQLEKELFAIVYGCRHYHHYLYGRKVQVITDH